MEVLRVFQSHMKSTRGVESSLPTQRAVLRQPSDQGKFTMSDNLNFSFKAILYLSLIIVATFYLWKGHAQYPKTQYPKIWNSSNLKEAEEKDRREKDRTRITQSGIASNSLWRNEENLRLAIWPGLEGWDSTTLMYNLEALGIHGKRLGKLPHMVTWSDRLFSEEKAFRNWVAMKNKMYSKNGLKDKLKTGRLKKNNDTLRVLNSQFTTF